MAVYDEVVLCSWEREKLVCLQLFLFIASSTYENKSSNSHFLDLLESLSPQWTSAQVVTFW